MLPIREREINTKMTGKIFFKPMVDFGPSVKLFKSVEATRFHLFVGDDLTKLSQRKGISGEKALYLIE